MPASSPRALAAARYGNWCRCRSSSSRGNSSCPYNIAERDMSPSSSEYPTPTSPWMRRISASVAAVLGLALASACAHAPTRTAEVPAPCAGQRMLVVNNHTDLTVDVYAYSRGSTPRFVGTAAPGSHELYLGEASGPFAAKVAGGKQVVAATGTQEPHVMDRVTFDTSCRTS